MSQNKKCDCRVVRTHHRYVEETTDTSDSFRIQYCRMHAAAEDAVALLQNFYDRELRLSAHVRTAIESGIIEEVSLAPELNVTLGDSDIAVMKKILDSVKKNKRTATRIPGKFNASLDAAHSICRKHGVGKYGIRVKIIWLLQSTFGFCDDDCHRWLRTPHDDLGGRTPKEVVEEGKGQTVIDMLEAAKAGQPS
jgi:hypothetical protein